MFIDVVTLFPEMFPGPLAGSITGRALSAGLADMRVHDLREWTHDAHRTADDRPFGGGAGMVMTPGPIFEALDDVVGADDAGVVLMTPAGAPFDQEIAKDLAARPQMVIICGRYEGVDERVRGRLTHAVSVGDFVLTGGELPAMIIIDAVLRLVPGVLGDEDSAPSDSFYNGLLDCPHYTRPAVFRGMAVPDVLRRGDHGEVRRWRRKEALRRTRALRPDLLTRAQLSDEDKALLREIEEEERERTQ